MEVPHSKKLACALQGQRDWASGQSSWKVAPKVRIAAEDCPPFQAVTGQVLSPSVLTPPWLNLPPTAQSVGSQLSAPTSPELPHPKR